MKTFTPLHTCIPDEDMHVINTPLSDKDIHSVTHLYTWWRHARDQYTSDWWRHSLRSCRLVSRNIKINKWLWTEAVNSETRTGPGHLPGWRPRHLPGRVQADIRQLKRAHKCTNILAYEMASSLVPTDCIRQQRQTPECCCLYNNTNHWTRRSILFYSIQCKLTLWAL